jgi:hypothetical protein
LLAAFDGAGAGHHLDGVATDGYVAQANNSSFLPHNAAGELVRL